MQRPVAAITGLGVYLPASVITNKDFEARLETTDQWIVERTGIRERRWAGANETVATMAKAAAEQAMQQAGITAADLDAIIIATATPDRILPSTACYLQALLGAEKAAAFDLSAACSGFIYGLTVGESLIGSGQAKHILVVGGEKLSNITDMQDRSTAILFGDGVGAVIVSATSGGKRGILSTFIKSDGRLAPLLYVPSGGTADPISDKVVRERTHFMKMAGREVFKHAVLEMAEACDEALKRAGIEAKDIDLLVPHQANIRIIDATARHAGIPEEKVVVTVDKFGNTSAASIPMALADAAQRGILTPGKVVLLVAFGAGFTWGAAVIRW
ncbi:MAG: beta-ketoacyl-ACP synthase III [Gemmatimonadales bacterium]